MLLQNSIRTWGAVVRLAARSTTERFAPVLFSVISTIITLYALFTVYGTSVGTAGTIRGMGLASVLWSLSMYSIYWGLGTRYIFWDISEDVRDGSIEVRLLKPLHYLAWRIAHRLGKQIPMLGQQLLVNSALLLVFVGVPDIVVSWMWAGALLGLFAFGIVLSIFIFTGVGLCAFWIENPAPVMWIVDKFVMIVGGAFVPIALFPNTLRAIAEWSPFGAMMGFSQAFTPDFLQRTPLLFVSQGVWLAIMTCVIMIMWHFAMRRVAINGG